MADAQKAFKDPQNVEDGEKVHIPDTFEDSDSDSDSFTKKMAKLINDGMGQSSKQGEDGSDKQIWFMKNGSLDNMIVDFISKGANAVLPSSDESSKVTSLNSPTTNIVSVWDVTIS